MGSDQEMEQRQKLGAESMFLCFQIIGWQFITWNSVPAFWKGFEETCIAFGGSSFVFHKRHLGFLYLFLRLG